MTLIKVNACRSVWGSLLNTYPRSLSCNIREAIGSVDITKLERDNMIDGENHKKSSLKNAANGRIESWPVTFLFSK